MPASQRRKEREQARERFQAGRKAEAWFARQLRSVANQVDHLVHGMVDEDNSLGQIIELRLLLDNYAEMIKPWAERVVERMADEVSRRDASAWAKQSKVLGQSLANEIRSAPTGEALKDFMAEQVEQITSLPREAAERLHRLTVKGITEGIRADEISRKVLETGDVTRARAMMLARTGVTTTASALTMVRAQAIGSSGYWWRTARDSDVRPLHKKLEGKFIRWDDPPIVEENGYRAHAGMSANCRCYMEPEIPDLA